jgi:site-specific recombinase
MAQAPDDAAALLARLDPEAPRPERHLWLIDLLAWVRRPARRGARTDPALPLSRWQAWLDRLEQSPALRERLRELLATVGRDVDAAALFADHGFAAQHALGSEVARRLALRWLPGTPDTDDLGELVQLLFRADDGDWLAALDPLTLQRLGALLADVLPGGWQGALLDALGLLVSAVGGAAQAPHLRRRMAAELIENRPFRQLPGSLAALREALESGNAAAGAPAAAYLRALLARCREAVASVFEHLEAHGVSVDIVFACEQLQRRLDRCDALLDCLLAPEPAEAWKDLLRQLVAVNGERRGLRQLLGQHYSLMARQIAERHAETGEHYITTDRAGYRDMLRRAAGGGLVIAATTFTKFAIAALALGTFWAGVWAGVNYAASFLLIMLLHWTVATKQPAMTAPALADSLAALKPGNDNAPEVEAFVDRITQLIRSQFAGIVGNVALCFPVVLAAQWIAKWLLGQPLVGVASAQYVLQSQTLLGPTLLFAAFTGVLLFASSLVAGWAENAFVFNRLDSALAWNPRISALLGRERAQRWSAWWRRNVSGVVANTSLGLMLGLVPALAAILGLGLEVRHITLSTGQLAAALGALGWGLFEQPVFWWCVLALPGIGALNLGVSFWLALRLAMRSRGIRVVERQQLARALRRRIRQAPLSFLLPPRG